MRKIGWVVFWLFLLGAIPGSAFDAIHVYRHVERYPSPALFGLAWWVPLLFGGAAVLIGCSHPLLDPLLANRRRPRSILVSISTLAWLLLVYLISASILGSIDKVALLIIIYFDFWLLSGKGWQNLLLSLVTAITGALIEMILVAAGAFSYLQPDIIGIPYWLPCLYAMASLVVGDLGRSLFFTTTRGLA